MKTVYLIGSGLLGLFYFAVFWLMFHPNVSEDYRAYYIDRTSNKNLRHLAEDKAFFGQHQSDTITGKNLSRAVSFGWHTAQDWGLWSDGKESRMRLYCDWLQGAETLDLKIRHVNTARVDISLRSGALLFSDDVDRRERVITLDAPEISDCTGESIDLVFRTTPFRPIDLGRNQDVRELGVGLLGITRSLPDSPAEDEDAAQD